MGIIVTHTAECDYCGKTATMSPINIYVPDAGYALPTGWFREPYRLNLIMCPDCVKTQININPLRPVKREVVKSEWFLSSVWTCNHCKHVFKDTLMQCPWCGAEMANGTTNYR